MHGNIFKLGDFSISIFYGESYNKNLIPLLLFVVPEQNHNPNLPLYHEYINIVFTACQFQFI